ncbi:Response regulator PleD [Pseudovibrio axinellae]|uniref:diguanylate cyclase n=1 Tax=Pseudovibrio axinellae TaxID=989403 RepID=A0A165XD06_9HYPH|nr:GGDEF domain-containing protein [Pseudovibrio axinellae]KZL17585.1 Response regulator PleD [Pseudovibrio axinellae]SER31922.1 diguanylate cyclase [Pseudovibrio axinellae]
MSQEDEFKRTVVYADSALDYIKTNKLPAFPRNYELWYSYASGFNRALNRTVNKILARDGKISPEDTQKIYNRFLSPNRLGERIDEVGEKISQEVRDLISALDSGTIQVTHYGEELARILSALDNVKDRTQLSLLIVQLTKLTTQTAESNQQLREQLVDSRGQIEVLQEGLEAIRYESLTDELTTLNNRKHFDQSLVRAIKEAEESHAPLSLLISDIDHFKQFNDNYGHQTGDQVLRLVALAVKQNVKNNDIACRYGGEEFGIILPRTSIEDAKVVAEKVRKNVVAKELVKRSTGENLGRITISIGISTFRPGDSAESMVSRADLALYAAKKAGRNLVRSEDEKKIPSVTQVA